jgi:hypothetical protein
MEEHRSPTILELSYAHDDDTKSAMSAKVQPLTPEEIGNRVESMTRRLKSQCKGFFWKCMTASVLRMSQV